MPAAERETTEPLWTPKDLAAYLQVSRSWIYSAIQRGLIPHAYFGGLLRFEPAKIRTWVESKAAQTARVIE